MQLLMQSSSHSHKHKSDKSSSKTSSARTSNPPLRFLFAITRLSVRFRDCEKDTWDNVVPPSSPHKYATDLSDDVQVMRFSDGVVTQAQGFRWYRPSHDESGGVWYLTEDGQQVQVVGHRECSVFSCGTHLPVVAANADVAVADYDTYVWKALKFFHSSQEHLQGVSFAVVNEEDELDREMEGAHPKKRVAGGQARWVPSLVPSTYSYSVSSTLPPRSRGLTGNLNVLLGLMALSLDPSRATQREIYRIFHSSEQRFSNYHWNHTEPFVGRRLPTVMTSKPHGHYKHLLTTTRLFQ